MAIWIIITGILVAANCGLLGTYLILRKNAMIGDAISHAVLPGIVLAFLVTESLNSIWLIVGAGMFGLLTTYLIETLEKKGRLQADAAIGLTFTWLFALGVILVSLFTRNTHIDADCVMHGEITMIPFDTWQLASGVIMGPRSVWLLGGMLLINLLVIKIGYKALFISSFDPSYAETRGIQIGAWHYILMGLVSLTTVLSFESVGAILVIAFLIVPAATAYLLTDKLWHLLVLSIFIGSLDVILGYFLSLQLDSSISGAITAVAGLIFGLVFVYIQLRQRSRREAAAQAEFIQP